MIIIPLRSELAEGWFANEFFCSILKKAVSNESAKLYFAFAAFCIAVLLKPALAQSRVIDCAGGEIFNSGVRGLNMLEDFTYSQRIAVLELAQNTNMRALPQISDGYDWRRKGETGDIDMSKGYAVTTLDVMRELRDTNCWGTFNAPIHGIGWFGAGIADVQEFQAETYGSAYQGSPVIQDTALDEGTSWLLRKIVGRQDILKITFTAPYAGRYDLHLRVKCGNHSANPQQTKTELWDNNNYFFSINSQSTPTFVGDLSTVVGPDSYDGQTYWGVMRAYHVPLLAGTNTIYIWSNVDRVRVDSLYRGTFLDQLAADRVRYINHILRNYRSSPNAPNMVFDLFGNPVFLTNGNPANPYDDDKRILDSIRWPGDYTTKLLRLGEPNVPICAYITVGNEPAGDISIQGYIDIFLKIRNAVKSVDPNVAIGASSVCPFDPAGDKPYLDALKAELQSRGLVLEYLDYHPYYFGLRNVWPPNQQNPSSISGLENALKGLKPFFDNYTLYGGNYSNRFMATEHNPGMWDCAGHPLEHSMAQSLGIVESVFIFAEQSKSSLPNRLLSANYWLNPVNASNVRAVFQKLRDYMGDVLLDVYRDDSRSFRMYTTRFSDGDTRRFIWGLNFSDSNPVTINLSLQNLPLAENYKYRVWQFGVPGNDTSLASLSNMLDWSVSEFQYFNPANLAVIFDDACITIVEITPENPFMQPYTMPLKSLGGGRFGHQQAVWDIYNGEAAGANNIGLLVRCFGRVSYIGTNYFYISDGSKIDDGSGILGVYVKHQYLGAVGDYVQVTGISSCIKKDGKIVRALRPRDPSDIVVRRSSY